MDTDVQHSLVAALSSSSHSFLQPTATLHSAAILSAKGLLDPLAFSIHQTQDLRKKENNKKRKRSEDGVDGSEKPLNLSELHTEGFGIGQIWEQARRILDVAGREVEYDLNNIQISDLDTYGGTKVAGPAGQNGGKQMLRPNHDDIELASTSSDDFSQLDAGSNSHSDSHLETEIDDFEPDNDLAEDEEDDIRANTDSDDPEASTGRPESYHPDPNGLNDGFFSIDDFNKQSQFQEQRDVMGEEDNPSDEDEIDWDADPLSTALPSDPKDSLSRPDEADSEDGDGPTFGNVDLDASSDEEEADGSDLGDEIPGLENTNEIKYSDFFEPPAQRQEKANRKRALPKTQPTNQSGPATQIDEDVGSNIERAISDVRRDLLDSEEDLSSDDEDQDEQGPESQPVKVTTSKNLSTHEKQRAKIASEIRRLETAAIAKRDWTMSGEARAVDRPMNSLIEEDLEFERAGKPVPVITAEVSEEIEALIKRRILARDFDEIVRRRPDSLGAAKSIARERVQIDDKKPSQGLADIYENEYLKVTDPGYVDKRSDALKRKHEEIGKLWKDVSTKLDVLSNLHFKPKRGEVNVQVMADKPTISMEDARPGAADGGAESQLAPQEIYTAGQDGRRRGEVMGKGGLARSKEEMTTDEKASRRRREKRKDKLRRLNDVAATSEQQRLSTEHGGRANKGQEKKNILDELRRGGVKVIGKQGNLEELGGKKRKGQAQGELSSSAYKL